MQYNTKDFCSYHKITCHTMIEESLKLPQLMTLESSDEKQRSLTVAEWPLLTAGMLPPNAGYSNILTDSPI